MTKLILAIGAVFAGLVFIAFLVLQWLLVVMFLVVVFCGVMGFALGSTISGGNEAVSLLFALGFSGLPVYWFIKLGFGGDKQKKP